MAVTAAHHRQHLSGGSSRFIDLGSNDIITAVIYGTIYNFDGIKFIDGKITLNDRPGIGAELMTPWE